MTLATFTAALGLRPAAPARTDAELHAAICRAFARREAAESIFREAVLREQVDYAIAQWQAAECELALLRRAAGAEPVERPTLKWLQGRETA